MAIGLALEAASPVRTSAPPLFALHPAVSLTDDTVTRWEHLPDMVVVLIGERPGLSSPDSLGVYLSWHPCPNSLDAERNCLSNVRPEGLSYEIAAARLLYLIRESRRRRSSGVPLKENADVAALTAGTQLA
jgi:ethanolamine ammonia-lyase small subunit